MSYMIKSEPWQAYADLGNRFDKRKPMPFFVGPALAAAGTAIAGAAAAGTAAAIGSAAVASFSALATVATAAGIAMTVVGAVTGDKELMHIGGYVGLAGGVGSLATSVLAPTVTALTSGSAAAAQGAAQTAATGTAAATGEAAIAKGLQATIPKTFSGLGEGAASGGGNSTSLTAGMAKSITPAFGEITPSVAATAPSTGILGSAAPTAATQGAITGAGVAANVTKTAGDSVLQAPGTQPGGGFFDFLKSADNKAVIAGGLQAVGSYMSDNQANQLARDKFNVEQQHYNRQLANTNTPSSLAPVTARDATAAEIAQANAQQAAQARAQAQILASQSR